MATATKVFYDGLVTELLSNLIILQLASIESPVLTCVIPCGLFVKQAVSQVSPPIHRLTCTNMIFPIYVIKLMFFATVIELNLVISLSCSC